MINIAKPLLGEDEEKAVLEAMRAGKLAQGEIVAAFEKEFAKYIGVKYAIATTSGTTALHLALLAAGVGPGDEVITTPFSFIASSNAILYTGAKPVFVDIDPQTFTIDPRLIEKHITKKTKAILPVHLYGLPANMKKIMAIAKKYKLLVIEDACQAHDAAIKNKKVGSFGIAAAFSFYPTKNMTTTEGGMITTNSLRLAKKLRLLRSHGMPKKYHHTELGYNFRMTDLAAAIGRVQLKKLDEFNKKRQKNALLYNKYLSKVKGIVIPSIPNGFTHVFHQYTIRITPEYRITRTRVMEILKSNSIISEVYYPTPIHQQKVYQDYGYKEKLPNAEKAAKEVLSLPIHPALSKEDIFSIIEVFSDNKK